MTSNIFHVFLNVRRFEKEHLSEKVPVLKSHEKSEIMVLLLEVVIEEVDWVTKQLVRDVYFEISRENKIEKLAKKLAYTNISEVENEESEINKLANTTISEVEKEENKIIELAKKLAYTAIFEVENEESEINELAKKLAYTTIFEAKNEENEINELTKQLALKSILQAESEENQINHLAKQVSLNSISVAENEENKIDQLAMKLVSNAVMEASSEMKIETKQLNGQVEIADSALFEDSVPIEEIFQEFMAKGADINDISSIADKFVGNLFHGIFMKEEEEQESEISSIAKSLIENFLSTEVDDSALFARLGQIIDEVFADVDDDDVVDVENESQQNILDKQQPSLSPATLEMQTQPISTLPTTLNDITTADEGAVANSIQQQQAPPLSKWRRFKNFFTCCWRPVVYDDDCQ